MKRRLFTILAALSLLLFAAVVALWVRSYWIGSGFQHADLEADRLFVVVASRGALSLVWVEPTRPGLRVADAAGWSYIPPVPATSLHDGVVQREGISWRFVGLGYGSARLSTMRMRQVLVPDWVILVPLLLATLWAGLVFRRLHRLANVGRCPHCHYDLRATPHQCPECGAVPRQPSRPHETT
jgi:hypothetical protein